MTMAGRPIVTATVAVAAMFGATLIPASQAASPGPSQSVPVAPIMAPRDLAYPGLIRLAVDAADVERRIIHVEERITGVERNATLLFPKWLPGNHSSTGPIGRLTGLRISAGGAAVAWTRDAVDIYAFHLQLPAAASAIDVAFDYLSAANPGIDSLEISTDLLVLNWNALLLYPAGYFARQIPVAVSLRIPNGWQLGTALETVASKDSGTTFRQTSLETLIDSPVYAGRYARRVDLDPGGVAPVTMNLFADRPELLVASADQLAAYRALVQQTYRLYGSRHYAHYDFLVALSDQLAGKGLEHHQSSENTVNPAAFTDWSHAAYERDLLAHEFTHSWNGKFRRPADLWTPNYNVPMQDSLLWVYEGQTEYWGLVLATRAGLWSRQQLLDQLALLAAHYQLQPGRQWRSLQDTTNDPIINHHGPVSWKNWSRYKDYYDEALLIWLEVDTLIRERSSGRRSLDDFARAFFGVNDGSMTVLTYTFADVVQALNAIEPYDWAAFLRQRLDGVNRAAPLDGLARGGYTLVYTDTPSDFQKDADALHKQARFIHSIGAIVSDTDGTVSEVVWNKPAFQAGLRAGTQILAVNGIAYEAGVLSDAIRAAQASHAAIQLILKAGSRFRVANLEYYDGLRYPHLERNNAATASLDAILTARQP
jgi:predicted metalloprotease with PDZ domain